MKRRIVIPIVLIIAILLLVTPALAMISTNYGLDWHTGLTGTGASLQSTHYAMYLTVGQSVNGGQASPGYQAGLGFWVGRLVDNTFYLPIQR